MAKTTNKVNYQSKGIVLDQIKNKLEEIRANHLKKACRRITRNWHQSKTFKNKELEIKELQESRRDKIEDALKRTRFAGFFGTYKYRQLVGFKPLESIKELMKTTVCVGFKRIRLNSNGEYIKATSSKHANGSGSVGINKMLGGSNMDYVKMLKSHVDNNKDIDKVNLEICATEETVSREDLEAMKVVELKQRAIAMNLSVGKMKKQQIIDAIYEELKRKSVTKETEETKENTKEEVLVKSNIPIIKGIEDDSFTMSQISNELNSYKYKTSTLVHNMAASIDKNTGNLELDFTSYKEVGQLPFLNNFQIKEELEVIQAFNVKSEEDDNARPRIYKTKENSRYQHIDWRNGLITMDFSKLSFHTKEQEMIKSQGVFVYEDSKGVQVTLDPKAVFMGMDYRYFRPYVWSVSNAKNMIIFYASIDAKNTPTSRFLEIDDLNGGAIQMKYAELVEKAKAGNNIAFDEIAKVAARYGIIVATPNVRLGSLNSILILEGECRIGQELNDEEKAKLKAIGIEIDTNFADGSLTLGLNKVIADVHALTGRKLTRRQALRLALQIRVNTLMGKGLGKVVDEESMVAIVTFLINNFVSDKADKVKLYSNNKLYTGEQLKELLTTNEKEFKNIVGSIEIIGSKDEFKVYDNQNVLTDKKHEVSYYLINAINPSDSGSSVQQANKVAEEFPEYMEIVANEILYDIVYQDQVVDGELHFNKDCTGLAGDQGANCARVAKEEYEDQFGRDKVLATRSTRSLNSFCLSKVAKMNGGSANSLYLALQPEDLRLQGAKHVLKKREVSHLDPNGNEYKVTVLESYSAKFNEVFRSIAEQLLADPSLNNLTKAKIMEALKVGVMIKYPSQGRGEYMLLYMMTDEEMKNRIMDTYSESAATTNMIYRNYVISSYAVAIIPNDNTLKNQIAGLDFDGDAMKLQLHSWALFNGNFKYGVYNLAKEIRDNQLSEDCIKKLHEKEENLSAVIGRECKISEEEILRDYVSLIVEKQFNKDNIYDTAIIQYSKDKKAMHKLLEKKEYNNNRNDLSYALGNTEEAETYKKLRKTMESKCIGDLFTLTTAELADAGYIPSDIFAQITDVTGLLACATVMGNNIGPTIRVGSLVIMSKLDEWFKDGVFNFELACKFFKPLTYAVANRTEKEIARYDAIFTEEERNSIIAHNLLGIGRNHALVNPETVAEFIKRVKQLPEDTTLDEFLTLRKDFDAILRGFGESSIDITKDINKFLGALVSKDVVNANFKCYGNLKAKDILSNINDMIFNNDKQYNVTVDKTFFDNSSKRKDGKNTIIPIADYVGDIKLYTAHMIECLVMQPRMETLVGKTNYKRYEICKQVDVSQYADIASMVDSLFEYFGLAYNPSVEEVCSPTKDLKYDILAALFNTANIAGMNNRQVYHLMQAIACWDSGKNNKNYKVFNIDRKYIRDLNTLMLLMGDISVQEYNRESSLKVKLTIKSNKQPLLVGTKLQFDKGVCSQVFDYEITLKDNYTGEAVVEKDGIYAQFDAYSQIPQTNDILLPILDQAKNDTGAYVGIQALEGFGFDNLMYNKDLSMKVIDKSEFIGLYDEDDTLVCRLAYEKSFEAILSKEIKDFSLIGTEGNLFLLVETC